MPAGVIIINCNQNPITTTTNDIIIEICGLHIPKPAKTNKRINIAKMPIVPYMFVRAPVLNTLLTRVARVVPVSTVNVYVSVLLSE